jgi:small-conductance mechanosensitive channel
MPGKLLTTLLLIVGLTAGTPAGARAQVQPAADDAAALQTAPVEIDGSVLFRVRGVSSFPAETRAALIRDRIIASAADPAVTIGSLHVVEAQNSTRIFAGDHAIMAVVDADAAIEQVSRAELATANLVRLGQAIAEYRAVRTPAALRRAAVRTLVAVVVLAAILAGLWVFWRAVDRLLHRRLQSRIHSVGIQSFEVMQAERIWAGLRHTLVALRTLTLLAAFVVGIGFILAQWPSTRSASRNMVSFAAAPLQLIASGFIRSLPQLVFLAVLFVTVRIALRIIRLFFEAVGRGTVTLSGFDPDWAQPTYKIVRVAVIAFGLIVAYPYIPGSESAAFKGVSLFIGIVFSLGSSSAISNIIAGYMMTYRRAFKVGDRVKIGEATGDVIEMRLQVTHLRSFKNEEIIIPNSQILSGEVVNYSSLAATRGLLLHTEVGIGYETPWRQVEGMLLEAANRTRGIGAEPRPFVLMKRLGDFAVVYELNAACRDVSAMMSLYTALHRNILDVFNEYGVQIMTPAYEGDPEQPKVVAPKDWYAAPSAPKAPVPAGTA